MEVFVEKYINKKEMYDALCRQLTAVISQGGGNLSILANASAVLKLFLEDTNWVGFYLWDGEKLTVGPFQGKPAVPVIEKGSGVCGTAVAEGKLQRVDDVHSCCNHIACDIASASEIVVPVRKGKKLLGVIDIDSPCMARFDEEDETGLTMAAEILGECLQ